MSRNSKIILAMCTIGAFLAAVSFSIIGPFFPTEAEKKGVSVFLAGLVFSTFQVANFITAPIFGSFLTKLGPNRVYVSGIIIGGVCTIVFGFIEYIPSGSPYAIAGITIRTLCGVGFSAFTTSTFAIVSAAFKKNIGLSFGALQTGGGMGYMIGPAVGGALYELGGFGLPFYVVGSLVILNGTLVLKFLPHIDKVKQKRKGSMFRLFKSPMVVVPLCTVFVGMVGITTMDSTLARHMEPFGFKTGIVGLFFTIISAANSIGSPIVGYLVDKKNIQAPIIIAGNLLFTIAYLILGPSMLVPFIPFEPWTVAIGLPCVGFALACCLIPTLKCMVTGAFEIGLEDNLDTYAIVSGLFNSVNCLGGATGPLVSGALVDEFGYPLSYTSVAMVSLFMMLVSLVFFSLRELKKRSSMDLSEQKKWT